MGVAVAAGGPVGVAVGVGVLVGIGVDVAVGLALTLMILSSPPPLDVVMYRALSGPSSGVRSRPCIPSSSLTLISLTRLPDEVNLKTRSDLSFREATASRPFHLPHTLPSRKMPPLVASVSCPDDHLAAMALGNSSKSVIGTLSW